MQFYPQDWRSDEALRMCSLAARGLWIECLALMHRADPYGHLVVKGKAPTLRELAKLVSASPSEVTRLLAELQEEGVCSVTDAGVITSRRMVRDEARRARERDRKRQYRDAHGGGTDSGTSHGTDDGTRRGTEPGTSCGTSGGTASGTIPARESRDQRPEARDQRPEPSDTTGREAHAPAVARARPETGVEGLTNGQLRHAALEVVSAWNRQARDPFVLVRDDLSAPSHRRIERALEGHPDVDWWANLFAEVFASTFLAGGGERGWVADFWWVLEHADEVAQGRYRDRQGKGKTSAMDAGLARFASRTTGD